MRVMTPAGPPMTWTRLSGPSGSLPCLPASAEDGDRDEAGDDRGGADAGHERAGGALLEQFGADEAVHDIAPSVLVSEKKTSSRFDSSRRIS